MRRRYERTGNRHLLPCRAPGDTAAVLQRESLVRFAKECGFENIVCYEDIGVIGLSISGRPAFARMQADIDAGKVQRVIVKSESRVGHSAVEVIGWISGIMAKGVEFIATVHPALPDGVLTDTMKACKTL